MTPFEINQLAQSLVPEVKPITEHPYNPDHGFWYNKVRGNGKEWLDNHGVQVGNCEVSYTTPLYTVPTSTGSTHTETQMDLAYEGCSTDTVIGHAGPNGVTWNNPQPQTTTQPSESPFMPTTSQSPTTDPTWTWANHQAYTNYQLMQTVEASIAERNQLQLSSYQPLDLSNPTQTLESAHRELWGQGYLPSSSTNQDFSLHLPVMQTASLMQSIGITSIFFTSQEGGSPSLMMVVDNDFVKSLPKGAGRVALGALKLLVPDMSDVPNAENPLDHLDRVGYNLGTRYDTLVQIQDLHSLAAKAGTLTGELLAFGPLGKVMRIAELPGVFCAIAEGGTIGAIFAQAENQNPLEGAFVGGVLGGGLHKLVGLFRLPRLAPSPLTDRALQIHPEKYSSELRLLERPALRGDIASEGRVINTFKPINRSNNYGYVTFVEHGQTKALFLGDMSYAGTLPDRGLLSKAGRALQKKTDRIGSAFEKPTGTPHEVNLKGQKALDEILDHPNKIVSKEYHEKFGEIIEIFHPNGHGARFTIDGKKMIGFLEPKK